MSKNKLRKFAEVERFENVLQVTDFEKGTEKPKGEWNERIFGNSNPITLELACGKGEYTVAMAERHPERNFIGIDIKGERIWKGAKRAREKELPNVRFLRIYIDHLTEHFAPGEVEEIWITFPDPFIKRKQRKKRLTSPKFLAIYKEVLPPGGFINLKTDSDILFNYTQEVIEALELPIDQVIENVYQEKPEDEWLTLQTFYEKQHLEEGRIIKFVRFRLDHEKLDQYLDSEVVDKFM